MQIYKTRRTEQLVMVPTSSCWDTGVSVVCRLHRRKMNENKRFIGNGQRANTTEVELNAFLFPAMEMHTALLVLDVLVFNNAACRTILALCINEPVNGNTRLCVSFGYDTGYMIQQSRRTGYTELRRKSRSLLNKKNIRALPSYLKINTCSRRRRERSQFWILTLSSTNPFCDINPYFLCCGHLLNTKPPRPSLDGL